MLPDTYEVEEFVIDHLAIIILGKFDYFLWAHRVHLLLLGITISVTIY